MDVPPSPKFQLHDDGEPVELSVNVTDNGAVPNGGVMVKAASGLEENAVMKLLRVVVSLPPAFVAVSETVYVPAAE